MVSLERLVAEHECAKLQIAYARTADLGDAEGFTALFTADASIHIPEYPPFAGQEAIHASLVALAASGVTMRHVITNQYITLTGADTAEGGCYLVVYNDPNPAGADGVHETRPPATVGEYADRFALTAAGWRFRERRLTRVFRSAA
ncbi:nuclear transport factor 2 family protein [Hephaestia sp. GCM10023244]|uniref:nuclear transport factor 2 family protein n=1 Tax=unclassified Hephaestia TaxID=2631281 RepID=UPI0020773586|nr:nuclear transport factor 2 family protein [Hephaestia sp. MAHUQ-44]MCM8729808.1 nuclear transport factor 2 family protein [Hephaestia sp. MAHUQ-44]